MVINRGLANYDWIKLQASVAINSLSRFRTGDDGEQTNNGDDDENALRNARNIDDYFETARKFCVYGLRGVFRPGATEEQVREVLARVRPTSPSSNASLLQRTMWQILIVQSFRSMSPSAPSPGV